MIHVIQIHLEVHSYFFLETTNFHTRNVPGPSSAGNQSTDSDLSQPGTSGMTSERRDPNRSQRVKDSLVKYLRTHRRNRTEESSEVSSTDSIKKEIEARRKDLIDKYGHLFCYLICNRFIKSYFHFDINFNYLY